MAKHLLQNCTPRRLTLLGQGDARIALAPLERTRAYTDEELAPFDLHRLECRGLVEVHLAANPRLDGLIETAPILAMVYAVTGFVLHEPWYWPIGGLGLVLAYVVALVIAARRQRDVIQAVFQMISLLLTMATAVGIPTTAIYMFGGGERLLDPQAGLLGLGRALQLGFIATASLLPGLLFYLFDREQLSTLRERFEQQIFRLDPALQNLGEVRAKYGRQMEEVFGREDGSTQSRLGKSKRWPILLATLVITLGWLLTLEPFGTPEIRGATGLISLFVQPMQPVVLAFLGAYFFALNMVLRRYVRRDLKPSAYASITVRIFIVVILAWVLTPLLPQDVVGPVAFMVGIIPETGYALIQEALRTRKLGTSILPSYIEEHPLTKLEGIDLYDRARLEDEGVTNVQGLAHHDLIDLMIQTRIPVPRLVDWVDQSILYLHVSRMDGGDAAFRWSARLGAVGIRNTTDLLKAYADARRTDRAPDFALASLLGADAPAERIDQLHALVATLEDDEWVAQLRHWRWPEPLPELTVRAAAPLEPESAHAQAAQDEVLAMTRVSDEALGVVRAALHVGGARLEAASSPADQDGAAHAAAVSALPLPTEAEPLPELPDEPPGLAAVPARRRGSRGRGVSGT